MKLSRRQLRRLIQEALVQEGINLAGETKKHKGYTYNWVGGLSAGKNYKVHITSPEGDKWVHKVVVPGETSPGTEKARMNTLAKKAINSHAKDGKLPPGWTKESKK